MDLSKDDVMNAMNANLNSDLNFSLQSNSGTPDFASQTGVSGFPLSCWDYWEHHYYPSVICESYPVYVQERAKDKGKQAFELIKMLKDGKFIQLRTVGQFIDLMDKLIKIL